MAGGSQVCVWGGEGVRTGTALRFRHGKEMCHPGGVDHEQRSEERCKAGRQLAGTGSARRVQYDAAGSTEAKHSCTCCFPANQLPSFAPTMTFRPHHYILVHQPRPLTPTTMQVDLVAVYQHRLAGGDAASAPMVAPSAAVAAATAASLGAFKNNLNNITQHLASSISFAGAPQPGRRGPDNPAFDQVRWAAWGAATGACWKRGWEGAQLLTSYTHLVVASDRLVTCGIM